jgi:uncharacterized integral membrane protein
MLKKISNVIIIAAAVIVTIISMANIQPVTLKMLIFDFEMPLIILIFMLLIIGFGAGYLVKGIIDYRKDRE